MNTLRPFSKKRLKKIADGKLKVGRSTFKEKTWEEAIAEKAEKEGKISRIVFGRADKPHLLGTPEQLRKKAKDAADKWFSEFIRLRDSDANGIARCVTCSHAAHWKQMQCGHYVTRGHQATRFNEQNSSCQCRGCNYNGGQHLKHATAIDARYGVGTAKKLEDMGRVRCSRTTSDYLFLADCYKKKVAQIALNEPNKFKKP